METLLVILLAISLLAVLGVLFTGLFAFVKGGEFHRKHGNRLMQLRVTAQAVAVTLVLLLVLIRTASD
jgi:predicted membrane metal-binding protein